MTKFFSKKCKKCLFFIKSIAKFYRETRRVFMGNIEKTEQFLTGEKGEKEFATWLEEVRGYIPGKDFIHYDWETHSKE